MQSFTPPVVNGWWPTSYVLGDLAWIAVGAGVCDVIKLLKVDGEWKSTGVLHLEPTGSSAGQFIRPGILSVWKNRDDVGKDFYERWEYDCLRASYTLVTPAAHGVGGNVMAAADGSYAALLSGKLVTLNGIVQAREPMVGACLAVGDDVIAFGSDPNDTTMAYASIDGSHTGSRVPSVPLHQIVCGPNERIVYGAYGPIIGFMPGANEIDLTVTPWRVETLYGGGAPHPSQTVWTGKDGRVWLATIAERGGKGMILLREWGEKECVIIERNAVHLSVVEDGADWFIASCSDRGALVVDIVPQNTPRRLVTETVNIPVYDAPGRTVMDLTFDDPGCPLRLSWDGDPNPGEHNVVGVFHTVTIADNGRDVEHRDNIDNALALCRAHGLPLYMVCDEPCEWPRNIPSYEGVVVVPMLEIYPVGVEHRPTTEPLIGLPTLKALAGNTLARLTATHDVAIAPAYYRQIDGDGRYSWPVQLVLDLHAWAWDRAVHNRRVIAFAPFSRRRGPADGYENIPELAESHRRLRQMLWLHPQTPQFPSHTPPPQEPQKPPQEPPGQPTEPTPPPPAPPEPQEPPGQPRRVLPPGGILGPDQYIESLNGAWRLYVQDDGNVVLLAMSPDGSSRAVWSTGTGGNRGLYLVMQYEGNVVAYVTPESGARWASSVLAPNSWLRVTDDGDLRLEAPDGSAHSLIPTHTPARPSTPAPTRPDPNGTPELPNQYALIPGQKLVSPSGQWHAFVGPIVEPMIGVPFGVWDSVNGSLDWIAPVTGGAGSVGGLGVIQGNVELWDPHTNVIWTSKEFSQGRADRLVMQDDGNLVAYAADGTAVWAKNSDPRR